MRKTIKAGMITTLVAAVLVIAGCTNNTTPDPNQNGNEVNEVINAYSEVVTNSYNHGKSASDLETLNTEVITALGDDGLNYDAALEVLKPAIPLDNIYTGDGSATSQIIGAMKVFNIMLSNTVNDVVSVEVDPNKVILDEQGTSANIAYSGVTFSSEQNETTGLADNLNNRYQNAEGNIHLILVENGWKVDMSTFSPNVVPDPEGTE